MKIFDETPLSSLADYDGLSVRAKRALVECRISTVAELATALPRWDMVRNCGARTVRELDEFQREVVRRVTSFKPPLRDIMAALALVGVVIAQAEHNGPESNYNVDDAAEDAYRYADALLKARDA